VVDITPVITAIAAMIVAGTTEQALFAVVARAFPDLTRTEFLAARQDATEAAERQAARRH